MLNLRGMTWDHPRGHGCLVAASSAFAVQTGISISWDKRSLQAFADASIEALAETYDLIVLDHPHVGLIADKKCLLPVEMPGDAGEASLGGSLESYIWNERLWALPIDAACQMSARRPDKCHAALRNWEDAFGARPSDYRIVTPLSPIDSFCMVKTMAVSRGEAAIPHSRTEFVSRENGVLALAILKELYRLGPSEATTWNPIKTLEAMSTTSEFAYSPCLFGYINYAREGFRTHRLEFGGLPVFAGRNEAHGTLGGAGIGVSARTSSPDMARRFTAWLASEPVQSGVYLENGGQPAHRGTWDRMGADLRYSGFLQGAREAMDSAWTRPRNNWYLEFVDEVCSIFPRFFLKNCDEGVFMDEINGLYRKHLARESR